MPVRRFRHIGKVAFVTGSSPGTDSRGDRQVDKERADRRPLEQVADLQAKQASQPEGDPERDPRELFEQISHIGVCMSYDLIDKLRFYEKKTANLPPEEIEKRLPHMAGFLEQLKIAYLQFSDLDL